MTKYNIVFSSSFKKSLKKLSSSDVKKTKEVISKLANKQTLDVKYKNHFLNGKLKDYQECHVKPNLLLIYRYYEEYLELYLHDVGSHSDLF